VVPQGVGTEIGVAVQLATGWRSPPNPLFGYPRPQVTDVMPSRIFWGETNVRVRIEGLYLGFGPNDVEDVSLVATGAISKRLPCNVSTDFRPIDGILECTVASTEEVNNEVSELYAQVTVGGQSSVALDASQIVVIGQPSVRFVQPTTGSNGGGDVISLTCGGIGDVEDDGVIAIRVGDAVLGASEFNRTGPIDLQFRMPPGAGKFIPMSVQTKG